MKFPEGIVIGLVIGLFVGASAATGGLSVAQQWLDMFTGRYEMLRTFAPVPMPMQTSTPYVASGPQMPAPQSGWCTGGPGRPTECGGSLAEQFEVDEIDT